MAMRWAETAWLLAAILVPVAYEPQASFHFIPIKSAIFQIAGCICWGAIGLGLAGLIHERAVMSPGVGVIRPVIGPVIAAFVLLSSAAVSTALSIDPSRSEVSRTIVSFSFTARFDEIGLFLSLALFLRKKEQLHRLISALLISSLPVVLLAILELYGLAPQAFAGKRYGLTSFAGGPIFLAGYLCMLLPVCVWKLSECIRENQGKLSATTLCYALLLTMQIIAFIGTEKRGPLLALLLSSMIAVVFSAWVLNRWRWVGRAVIAAGVIGAVLTALAIMHKFEFHFEAFPWLQKLALIVPVGVGTGDVFRDSLWKVMPEFVFATEALRAPHGGEDPAEVLRQVFGYGPDTVRAVLPSRWIWLNEWPRTVLEISTHSIFWDVYLMLGAFGLVAVFGFLFEICLAGLHGIGLPNLRKVRFLTLALCMLCGTSAGLILSALYHSGYFGLGFSIGFILAFPLVLILFRCSAPANASNSMKSTWATMAVLTGFLAHWIDMGFVFPTGNTNFLFWVFGGILAALGSSGAPNVAVPEASESQQKNLCMPLPVQFPVVLTAVLSAMLTHGFIESPVGWKGSWSALLLLITGVFLPTYVMGSIMFRQAFALSPAPRFLILVSISSGLVYAAVKWILAMDFFAQANFLPWLMEITSFLPLALITIAAWILSSAAMRLTHRAYWVQSAYFIIAGWCMIAGFNGRALRAESLGHMGDFFYHAGKHQEALKFSQRSLELDSGNTVRRAHVANLQLHQNNPAGALKTIGQGVRRSSFNELTALAGDIHLQIALAAKDPKKQTSHALHARYAYAQAVRYNPQNEMAWFHASFIENHFFNNPNRAATFEHVADEICSRKPESEINISPTVWGKHYAQQFHASKNLPIATHYYHRAMNYLNRAIPELHQELSKPIGSRFIRELHERNMFWSYLYRGNLKESAGDRFGASMDFLAAAKFRPEDIHWQSGNAVDFRQWPPMKSEWIIDQTKFLNESPPREGDD